MVTQKCITVNSPCRIISSSSLPAAGVICVPTNLLAPRPCPDGDTDETFSYSTVDGTIVQEIIPNISCNVPTVWKYVFCFDAALIADGQDITSGDVTGIFYKGCKGTWVEDRVGDEVTLVDNGDGTLTLTSQHGCTTTFYGVTVGDTVNYLNIDTNATAAAVSSGPTTLLNFYITNNNGSVPLYVKLYDQLAAPDPSTDTPVKELLVPAVGSGATGSPNWTFATKAWVRGTTGVAYTDNTSPGTNELIVNFELTA